MKIYGKLKDGNHLNAVLVLYTKKTGFATRLLTENEN